MRRAGSSRTDYEQVAPVYNRRYELNTFPELAQTLVDFVGSAHAVLEVGCGTGHWLATVRGRAEVAVTGLDSSSSMLQRAREALPDAAVIQASAERLPLPDASFDRVFIVNAIHHFKDPLRALRETFRVLRANGAVLVVGLDPSQGCDRWCIYDYFPGTRERDAERYPSAAQLRAWMTETGFRSVESFVAQRILQKRPARKALAEGALDKRSTSQLTELDDEDYRSGVRNIEQAIAEVEKRGEELTLDADLTLFGTRAMRAR